MLRQMSIVLYACLLQVVNRWAIHPRHLIQLGGVDLDV